jgi:hypothetical protein
MQMTRASLVPASVSTALIVGCCVLSACAGTDAATRSATRVSVHQSQNVTEYRTPAISLRQSVDLARFPMTLIIRGGCEGERTHCRPDTVVWEFDASAEYWQYQVDPQLEIFLDGVPHVFQPVADLGPLGALSVVTQSRYVIPFSVTERVALQPSSLVRIGGNDLPIDERRKQTIVQMTRTIQGRAN